MLSLSKFFLFALLISPGIASCQDQQVKADSNPRAECRACGCNRNKTKYGRKEKFRCGICAPAPQEATVQENQEEVADTKCGCTPPPPQELAPEETIESKCGCTPPPPQVPPQPDELDLVDASEYCLKCGCNKNKPPRRDPILELIDQIEQQLSASSCGCPTTPAKPDCGCPKPTPKPDCGCPTVAFARSYDEVKCGICAPAPQEPTTEENQDDEAGTKCGCTPPPPQVPPQSDKFNAVDASDYCLKCGCNKNKPPRRDLVLELIDQIEQQIDASSCGCPTTPTKPDCGCPKPTPKPDCGCPTVTYAQGLRSDISCDEVKCGICAPAPQEQPEQPEDTKKVRPAELLEGLAQTSYQAGNIVSAPTKKEKHQAVCNLVGSILHLAAQVTKKEHKNPTAHSRSIMTITHQILNNAKQEHLRSQIFTNKPYLIILNSVEPQERNQLVSQLLSNPEDSRAFLKELFETAGEYLSTHETTVQDALLAALQDLTNPEITANQRTIDNQSTAC